MAPIIVKATLDDAPELIPPATRFGTSWPGPREMLLLQTCFASGPKALKAWEEWSSQVDFDHLEGESNRLLPFLYTKLSSLGVSHPWMGRMKGYYRFNWVKNARLLSITSKLVHFLREIVGDDQIVLKGGAIACVHSTNIGLRSLEDIDIMIRGEVAFRAIEHLRAAGWRNVVTPDPQRTRALRFHHARGLRKQKEVPLDLHWNLMDDLSSASANSLFWEASQPAMLPNGTKVKVLHTADHLFHCCLHGIRAMQGANLRWIPDALLLIPKLQENDWDRLLMLATKYKYCLRLGRALEFLRTHLPESAQVPSFVVKRLLERSPGRDEIEEFEFHNGGAHGSLLTRYRWFRLHSDPPLRDGLLGNAADFRDYIMEQWKLQSLTELPAEIASRFARRLRKRRRNDLRS